MKLYFKISVFILIVFSLLSFAFGQKYLNLMPYPAKLSVYEGQFSLTKDFSISIKGNPDKRLFQYLNNFVKRLSGRTGLFFNIEKFNSVIQYDNASMLIECKRNGKVVLGEDESYSLNISDKQINLKAENDIGIMRGLETILQLLSSDANGYYFPALQIDDSPRFKWRGLMIDVARHFMPVDVIKRNLDAMAAVKMNVLHLHLSDNQGVRVESKIYPKIQELCSDGEYFTQEQIKEIVSYASDRGIRVIPEFDIPWHTTAWFVAFPELASQPGPYKIERNWGIFDPVFNPAIEETYIFFDKFFGEMATLFPDEYFHIGGDEGTDKHWLANQQIVEFMKKNNIPDVHKLHRYFNLRILDILTKYNKKMIGWDETLLPEMPTNIVIQSWRGIKSLFESAKKGYMSILSNGYYIDLIQPTDFHYFNDPLPDSLELSNEEKERILGGETTMWSELVTPETIDSRIWPRTIAIAERFWSPAHHRDINSMYARSEIISYQLEELGLTHIKNQDMMLRRLSAYNDITPLKTLLEVIEPVKIYTRHHQGVKYTSLSPYTRIVDAAIPDVKKAREIRKKVDELIKTRDFKLVNELLAEFQKYKNNHSEVLKLIEKSPIIREIEPLSYNLKKLSEVGINLVMAYKTKIKITDKQKLEYQKIIDEAKKPYGQVEIMIVSAIDKLLKSS